MFIKLAKKWYLRRVIFNTKIEISALRQQLDDNLKYANDIHNDFEDRILAVDAASFKRLKIKRSKENLDKIRDELYELENC